MQRNGSSPDDARDRTERAIRAWPARVTAALLLVVILGAMTGAVGESANHTRRLLVGRFAARASTAASFAASDVSFTLGKEQTLASLQLNTATVSQEKFTSFLQVLGFGPALLLDGDGRALNVTPYKASLIGTEIASKYAHLSAALAGHEAVSNVVQSAVAGVPVTAFAVPFETPFGPRVVSGAYDLAAEPLGIYLHHLIPWADSPVYLVDEKDEILSGSTDAAGSLAQANAHLAAGLVGHSSGYYTDLLGKRAYFVSVAVDGTPWHLVLTIPTATLFPAAPVNNMLLWGLLAAFAVVAIALSVLFIRGLEDRRHLALEAHIDALTGISNRRSIDQSLTAMLSSAVRHDTRLGFLMIDVDNFKAINDRYGHPVGDEVLKGVATRIRSCLRVEDVVGRWGGEEFVVLVSSTTGPGAETVAERIRSCIAATPFVSSQHELPATISIGVALNSVDDRDGLIGRADAALYLAKETGRNRVVSAPNLLASTAKPVTPER